MKKIASGLISIATLICFSSCEKMGLNNCLENTGKTIRIEREVNDLCYINLSNNVNLILTQDSFCSLSVEAGENIIDKVITEVSGNSLYIRNENKCNWLRSYDKEINVYLSVSNIDSIDYNSSGVIISTNTILNDTLSINVEEGCGSIDMEINVYKAVLNLHYGTVDFKISGKSKLAYIFNASYGPIHCHNLNSTFTYINNQGTNDCYVRASHTLEATIEFLGNIYYYGNPSFIKKNITGQGELIKLGN
jgi:Putative auto-transporter adhesin, head GIN domain